MSFLRLTFFHLYRMILEKKFYFYVNFAVQIWHYKSKKVLENSKKIGL